MRAACPRLAAAGLILALLAGGGCVSPSYAPAPYKPAQDRFGAIPLPASGAKLVVCPTIDRLSPANRKRLSPAFTPWVYLTEALEAELRTSGLTPDRAAFAFGPSFEALREAIRNQPESASRDRLFLGTELLTLTPALWILDAELISPRGECLFAKRAIASTWGTLPVDEIQQVHMLLRQVLADPRLKAAFP